MKGKLGRNKNANGQLYRNGKHRVMTNDERVMAATPAQRARFWASVRKGDTCWLFAPTTTFGYGKFNVNFCMMHAHRVAKLWADRNIPVENVVARHKCRNRNCVKPSHIEWGTTKQNIHDKLRDKTNKPWAHCGQRHPRAKITDQIAIAIWDAYNAGHRTMASVADEYSVSTSTVNAILRGNNWRDVLTRNDRVRRNHGANGTCRAENSPNAKLTENAVRLIRTGFLAGETLTSIAKSFNVSRTSVSNIVQRRSWQTVE